MDLRVEQLRRFVVLADELNFTRAAARVHLSQQALSAQVRQLEAAVGAPLLTRTTRRVELTAAGEAFLGRARAAVEEADGAVRAAREAAGRQQLLLACEIDAQWLLAERLDAFRTACPDVAVVLVYLLDVATLAELTASRIDAVALWGTPPPELTAGAVPLAVEEVCAVLPDRPGPTGPVTPADLAGRTLWLWPPATGRQAWERLADHAGVPHGEVGIVGGTGGPSQELMLQAVRDKGGWTVAPASYLRRAAPAGLVAVPFAPPLRLPLTLCWRGSPPPALRRLVAHLDPGRAATPP